MPSSKLILHISKTCRVVLRPGQGATLGRSLTNSLVFEDKCMSRTHCSIEWSYSDPLIVDCASSAGIIVDGERVDRKYLSGKHRILLGNTRLLVDYQHSRDLATETHRSLNEEPLTTSSEALLDSITDSNSIVMLSERRHSDETGTLTSNQELRDYLIQLEMDRRSGTLYLTDGATKAKASVIFAKGSMIDAKMGILIDLEALINIFNFNYATYDFVRKINVGNYRIKMAPSIFIRQLSKMDAGSTRRF